MLSGPESGVGMGTTSGYTASTSPRRVHFLSLAVPEFRPSPGSVSGSTQGPGEQGLSSQSSREAVVKQVSTQVATPLNPISMALFAQQLPTLPNFNRDHVDGDGESSDDLLERLELVAGACNWNDQVRLLNVATCLHLLSSPLPLSHSPPAISPLAFRPLPPLGCCLAEWSSTPQQRSTYSDLTASLCKRFTPVRIQSVQSSPFHERRQRPGKNVDNYAQDLRKLFHQAYGSAQSEGQGVEVMTTRCWPISLLQD